MSRWRRNFAAAMLTTSAVLFSYQLGYSRGWDGGHSLGVREERACWMVLPSRTGATLSGDVIARRVPWSQILSRRIDVRQVRQVNYVAQPFPPFWQRSSPSLHSIHEPLR
jgi:hypothetical protein